MTHGFKSRLNTALLVVARRSFLNASSQKEKRGGGEEGMSPSQIKINQVERGRHKGSRGRRSRAQRRLCTGGDESAFMSPASSLFKLPPLGGWR